MLIRTNLEPGDIGDVISLHGILYTKENGLDYRFEGYVAATLGEFAQSFDESKDRLWLAEDAGRLMGSIAIVGLPDQSAQLRWFLLHPDARGRGLGRKLLTEAVAFCRERGFQSVFLWTVSELLTAAALYQQAGFRVTEEHTRVVWGGTHTEVRYDLNLQGD